MDIYRVTPAYYEIALKTKYLDGDDDAEMYDIIVHGKKYDLGMIYSNVLGDVLWTGCNVIGGEQGFSSYYASIESSLSSKLDSMTEKLQSLN